MKTFSIIIPVYNGRMVIGKALDSIYAQGLADEQFEVICVDDCSPTMETYDTLNNYTYNGKHPTNLKVLRHDVNKRQGGGRNTGVREACGRWILFLDQDDKLVEGCLKHLIERKEEISNLDMLMVSHRVENVLCDSVTTKVFINDDVDTTIMSGCDYICKNQIGWAPWCYIYSRTFLSDNKLFFEENVRWEDLDYVMNAILSARRMSFLPIETYHYILDGNNTSFMGSDIGKVRDWFRMSIRVKNVAEDYMNINKNAAMIVMNHHVYHYSSALKTVLWRLTFRDILYILENYKPYDKSKDVLINWVMRFPRLYATIAQVMRPILLGGLWIKNYIKR